MKNLNPLLRKAIYWDGIVGAKRLSVRADLNLIRPSIVQRFTIYSSHCKAGDLELITKSTISSKHAKALVDCYSIKSKGLSKLKKAIKDHQADILKSECQYCNIGEPSTFDHYLPKGKFPEFSVLSTNLIPCCFQCNLDKGEKWLNLKQRRFINLYYDVIPKVKYLEAKIYFKRKVPYAKFKLNITKIPPPLQAVISNHFKDLKLLIRYQERSGGSISDLLSSITPYSNPELRLQVKVQLDAEANEMRQKRGENYWRAAIIDACIDSNQFLDFAGY